MMFATTKSNGKPKINELYSIFYRKKEKTSTLKVFKNAFKLESIDSIYRILLKFLLAFRWLSIYSFNITLESSVVKPVKFLREIKRSARIDTPKCTINPIRFQRYISAFCNFHFLFEPYTSQRISKGCLWIVMQIKFLTFITNEQLALFTLLF